ncbi:MAG: tyrosine-type recombinase/integrase [bacterium]
MAEGRAGGPRERRKAFDGAVRAANIVKPASFPHAFATHLLNNGYDIRTVQELVGHADCLDDHVYTRVLNRGGRAVRSPLDGVGV